MKLCIAQIIFVLIAADTIPVKGISSPRRFIAEWEEQVSSSKDKALFWYKLWKHNGCPHQGILADIRQKHVPSIIMLYDKQK